MAEDPLLAEELEDFRDIPESVLWTEGREMESEEVSLNWT